LSLSVTACVQEHRLTPTVTSTGVNREFVVNNIIYIVGLVVVVGFIASFVLGHV